MRIPAQDAPRDLIPVPDTLRDLFYNRLVAAVLICAARDAQQNSDPVLGAEAEIWLRGWQGEHFLDYAGYNQSYALRQMDIGEFT